MQSSVCRQARLHEGPIWLRGVSQQMSLPGSVISMTRQSALFVNSPPSLRCLFLSLSLCRVGLRYRQLLMVKDPSFPARSLHRRYFSENFPKQVPLVTSMNNCQPLVSGKQSTVLQCALSPWTPSYCKSPLIHHLPAFARLLASVSVLPTRSLF